jgi:hypothetical protein
MKIIVMKQHDQHWDAFAQQIQSVTWTAGRHLAYLMYNHAFLDWERVIVFLTMANWSASAPCLNTILSLPFRALLLDTSLSTTVIGVKDSVSSLLVEPKHSPSS